MNTFDYAYDNRMRTQAFAKVNLFLNITGVLPNGYHTLEMVNAKVSLYDDVQCTLLGEAKIDFQCETPGVPVDESNTAWQAAARFLAQTRAAPGVRVILRKRIPHGAGLGGGSSDAAAVLRTLNQLVPKPLSLEALMDIGLGIGADVPFFIEPGCCYTAGVGERVMRIPSIVPPPDLGVVICSPGEGVATGGAYGLWDKHGKAEDRSPRPLMRAISTGEWNAIPELMYNAFEQVIFEEYPKVKKVYNAFKKLSPTPPRLSGSGSNLFSVHPTLEDAEIVAASLSRKGYTAAAHTLIL